MSSISVSRGLAKIKKQAGEGSSRLVKAHKLIAGIDKKFKGKIPKAQQAKYKKIVAAHEELGKRLAKLVAGAIKLDEKTPIVAVALDRAFGRTEDGKLVQSLVAPHLVNAIDKKKYQVTPIDTAIGTCMTIVSRKGIAKHAASEGGEEE